MFARVLAGAASVLIVASPALAQAPLSPSAQNVRAHMRFLADDALEGREAGTRGYDIAANYVVAQLEQLGVMPGAANGAYLQTVPMVAYRSADQGKVVLKTAKGEAPLAFGTEYLPGKDPLSTSRNLTAPMVFVGYGVVAPKYGQNDYRGLDVKGKIVVALSGAPKGFQTEERAHYGNNRTKRAAAMAAGAVGFVTLQTPEDEKRRPFANGARNYQSWSMSWKDAKGETFFPAPTTPQLASLSLTAGDKLFAGAKTPLAQVHKVLAAGGAPKGFALPGQLSVATRTETKDSTSANVVGLIEGSDPKLKDEVVILSAHLDHEGISAPVNGDSINNGALDNASGVSTQLEVARAFMTAGKPPRRSVMFVFVTAEEKGLLGAEYFARNPTTSKRMVANVNLDMPILTYDFVDVIAFGSDRSSLGPSVRAAAARMNVALSKDPMPEEGLFTRSDHYRFVEQGVPSMFLMTGFGNTGEEKFRGFLRDHYHKPSDDLRLPIDYEAGAKFAKLNYEISREIADAEARPAWNQGDFFGDLFGKR